MKIRKATKKDFLEIAKLFKIESAKKPYLQKWTSQTSIKNINKMFENGSIYVASFNKEIVGFIAIAGEGKKDAYIDEFWIKLKYQRQGVGKNLLEQAEKKCRKKGIKSVTVMANKKAGAFKFYKKSKYRPKNEDVFMVKKLK